MKLGPHLCCRQTIKTRNKAVRCCLAHVLRDVFCNVVANRRQRRRRGKHPPRGKGIFICSCRSLLTTNYASLSRRSMPFLRSIATPPTFGRSLRFLYVLHNNVFLQDSLDKLVHFLQQLSDLSPSETGFIVSAPRLPNITLLTLIAAL